jgi:hypothetical protein
MTRTKKNQELTEEIEKDIELESVDNEEEVTEEYEEKNLYDLIDMMYENKE